ncbi:MAG: hypothetical protein VX529_06635 [Pseudomonadota bacterium]|nr:hypothetical protein [Pseudomonadota bacterium]
MKRILLAGGAIATLGAAAWAIDDDKQHTRILVSDGHQVIMNAEGRGPVVEIRGENGERTIHMERDGRDTTLRIDGQTVEIADGVVTVDGERIEAGADSMIIVGEGDIRVVERNFEMAFDTEFAAHMAERAEHLARMQTELAGNFDIEFDFDGEEVQAEVMRSLEEALANLERSDFHHDGDWDDLTPEEQAEIREELREAREEIREAMAEVRIELAEVEREMEGERRRVRIELRDAERDIARAQRDMVRAERDIARAARDAAREERRRIEIHRRREHEAARADESRHRVLAWRERTERLDLDENSSVRIEQDDDGRRRVWVDGEEQTGDALIDWLNRLEADRLAGNSEGERRRRHVERLHLEGDREHRIIESDDGERVVILEFRSEDDE